MAAKILEREVIVVDAVRETKDSTTLYLSEGDNQPEYKAGQFLTVDPHQFPALERWCLYLEKEKGRKEPVRAYSLASAPHEEYVSFTVKEDPYFPDEDPYPPLLSPILTFRTPVGTELTIKGYTGSYTMNDELESNAETILHGCAGSGIVPNFAIIKDELHNGSTKKHILIFTNKTWNDIIYRDALRALESKYPDKLTIIHMITREKKPELESMGARWGRPTIELLREVIKDPSTTAAFICGPGISSHEKKEAKKKGLELVPRFLETMLQFVEEIGIPKEMIKKETW